MGEYVAEEFKKVKISLSDFELLKVPAVRHAFFRVLNETPSSSMTLKMSAKKVTFEEFKNEPEKQDNTRKRRDIPKNQLMSKQIEKEPE